jgi:hypothetical protein
MITVDPITEYGTEQIKPGARHAGRRWCHLEDTDGDTDKLHAFAARIGIPRRWFQIGVRGTFPHYDLTPRYRLKAIQAGAVELTSEDSRTITHRKFVTNRHFAKGDARYGKKIDADGRVLGLYSHPRVSAVSMGGQDARRVGRATADTSAGTGREGRSIELPGFLD